MALLHFDGFSSYLVRDDMDRTYTREDSSTNLNVIPAGGPSERGAIRIGGINRTAISGFFKDLVTAHDEIYMGFWFRLDAFDSTDDVEDMVIQFTLNTTTIRASMWVGEDGHIEIRRNETSTTYFDSSDAATTLDGETHFLSYGPEHKIELRMIFRNATGAFEVRVNGEVWARSAANADFDGTIDQVHFRCNDRGSGIDYQISDLYILDETGAFNNSFLGTSWQVEVLRPDAEAAGIAFTPDTGVDNSAMVDDTPQHDFDSTGNESTGDAQVDRLTTTDTLAGGNVVGAKVINVARHLGTAQNFRAKIFEGATGADGADVALAESFEIHMEDFETNPDTSLQWTPTELEACEFGYESRA